MNLSHLHSVEYGVVLDDQGSTDIYDTEAEARANATPETPIVRIVTAPIDEPSVQPPTREQIAEAIEALRLEHPPWRRTPGIDAVLALFPHPTPSAEPNLGPTVGDLGRRHCETFTSDSTCADDPDRSADSPYGATGYCYPCLIRNALSLSVAEPCCSRPGDPNWHTASGGHVVPPDIEEDTPVAEPVSIADMAPGTKATQGEPTTPGVRDMTPGTAFTGTHRDRAECGGEPRRWFVYWSHGTGNRVINDDGQIWSSDSIDPSTIRDVTPPKGVQ